MASRKSDILMHPVRLRIVLFAAGDEVTTTDLAQRLPDVPQATLYRHIGTLTDAGILDIVDERQARGAVERTFRVNNRYVSVGAAEAGEMSSEEHLQAFTLFAGVLIETYARYLDTPDATPATDGVSFRQVRLWLTDSELGDLVSDVTAALAHYLDLEKTPDRTPRLLNTILMPDPMQTAD